MFSKLVLAVSLGAAAAFVPPTSMQQLTRATVSSSADVEMFMGKKGTPKSTATSAASGARPLSPGSNYPGTKNIQTQANGFGTFLQKFQLAGGKSKYGVPIFLPNGNVNPKYLALEREEQRAQSKKNTQAAEAKRKKLIAKKNTQAAEA